MPDNPHDKALPARAQKLLKALVERYISEGQPVGSRTLAKDAGLDVSAATVRNVMADLEELGLVRSPHTSAGRVPTVLGYRLFVDSLLTVRALDDVEVRRISHQLASEEDVSHLLSRTSSLLSEVTRMASVVMLPRVERHPLRHVEFLNLSEGRVLVIMVINRNEVQNRIIRTTRRYSQSELEQAANYLNQAFIGRDISEVRDKLLEEMQAARDQMGSMMQAVIEMTQKAFIWEPDKASDYLVAGQTNLMDFAELAEVEKLRELFDAFNHKRDLLQLLDQALAANGVQIFIGEESGYKPLGDCSIVTSTYEAEGRVVGVLGVIGPTRMAYERVIPVVDLTAKVLGSALNSLH